MAGILATDIRRRLLVIRIFEAKNHQHGTEEQQHRQRVLAFREPCHRLDRHRMNSEQRRREPYADGHQRSQDAPQHDRGKRMQEHIHAMAYFHVQVRQAVFEPPRRKRQRVVVGRRSEVEPDSPDAARFMQDGVVEDVPVVIPHRAGLDRRPVRREYDEQQSACRHGRLENDGTRPRQMHGLLDMAQRSKPLALFGRWVDR